LNGRRDNPDTAEKPATLLLVDFALIPYGNRNAVTLRQIKIIMDVPFGIQRGFEDVGRVLLSGPLDDHLRKRVGKSYKKQKQKEIDVNPSN
jgi:hypothetical protein